MTHCMDHPQLGEDTATSIQEAFAQMFCLSVEDSEHRCICAMLIRIVACSSSSMWVTPLPESVGLLCESSCRSIQLFFRLTLFAPRTCPLARRTSFPSLLETDQYVVRVGWRKSETGRLQILQGSPKAGFPPDVVRIQSRKIWSSFEDPLSYYSTISCQRIKDRSKSWCSGFQDRNAPLYRYQRLVINAYCPGTLYRKFPLFNDVLALQHRTKHFG
jgi:hypothetical protein